jgi:hypothetical protein
MTKRKGKQKVGTIEGLNFETHPEEGKTRKIGRFIVRRMSGDLSMFNIPGLEADGGEHIENKGKTQEELNAELDRAQAVDRQVKIFQTKAGRRLSRINKMMEAA